MKTRVYSIVVVGDRTPPPFPSLALKMCSDFLSDGSLSRDDGRLDVVLDRGLSREKFKRFLLLFLDDAPVKPVRAICDDAITTFRRQAGDEGSSGEGGVRTVCFHSVDKLPERFLASVYFIGNFEKTSVVPLLTVCRAAGDREISFFVNARLAHTVWGKADVTYIAEASTSVLHVTEKADDGWNLIK